LGFDAVSGAEAIELGPVVKNLRKFETWLQTVLNMRLTGSPEQDVQRANSFRVWLKLRRRPGMPGVGQCAMKCQVVYNQDDSEDAECVHLKFSLRRSHARAQQRAVGNSGSSSGSSIRGRGTPRSLVPCPLGVSIESL